MLVARPTRQLPAGSRRRPRVMRGLGFDWGGLFQAVTPLIQAGEGAAIKAIQGSGSQAVPVYVQTALQTPAQPQSSIDTSSLLLYGGLGLLAVVLLTRRS